MLGPSHSSLFVHPNNIWLTVQIINLLFIQEMKHYNFLILYADSFLSIAIYR